MYKERYTASDYATSAQNCTAATPPPSETLQSRAEVLTSVLREIARNLDSVENKLFEGPRPTQDIQKEGISPFISLDDQLKEAYGIASRIHSSSTIILNRV